MCVSILLTIQICAFFLENVKFVPTNARSSPSLSIYTMSSVSVYLLQWVQSISRLSVEIYMGRLPGKYEKLLAEVQDVFDLLRNMAKYRNPSSTNTTCSRRSSLCFLSLRKTSPSSTRVTYTFIFLLPNNWEFGLKNVVWIRQPVCLQAITPRWTGLVNFEKLRMIAREIRPRGWMAFLTMTLHCFLRLVHSLTKCILIQQCISYTQNTCHQ